MTLEAWFKVGFCLFLIVCAGFAVDFLWGHRDGQCVRDKPLKLTGGKINGSFTSYCWLAYAGSYEHSGDKCEFWDRVTEAKYSREMYGDE